MERPGADPVMKKKSLDDHTWRKIKNKILGNQWPMERDKIYFCLIEVQNFLSLWDV